MTLLPNRTISQKTERLAVLKQRAQAVLNLHEGAAPEGSSTALNTAELLEDLRIYQVELEMQNDELRAAQQEADLLHRRYQSLFELMPLPALVVDGNGAVDDCNERASALLGRGNHNVNPDNRFWHVVHKGARARLHAALRDVRSGESMLLQQVQILSLIHISEPTRPY